MRTNIKRAIAASFIIAGCTASGADIDSRGVASRPLYGKQIGMSQAIIKSDLFAGLLVAYEDYVAYCNSHGERVDAQWVRERLGAITLLLDGDEVSVSFGRDHPGFGGSLDYIVDLQSMSVIERKQGR